MITLTGLNWLAIIVAAIVFFGLAAVWYQPRVMGRKWMEAAGVEPPDAAPNPMTFVGVLVAYFVMAIVLAMVARGVGASSFVDGLALGLATGVAFVAAQAWVNVTFEQRSKNLVLVNGGIGIIGHVAMAVIVTVWS
ncbi:MAG: DUF1761 domain-containing protein [bacterium]|nr:DUF1761 domain-containing protein [bacterium]MDE0290727.1 DUF1761 domain-containing protein [bacterium]MDE0440031.1 DUF1761 domain-containing protein [bacterium]